MSDCPSYPEYGRWCAMWQRLLEEEPMRKNIIEEDEKKTPIQKERAVQTLEKYKEILFQAFCEECKRKNKLEKNLFIIIEIGDY